MPSTQDSNKDIHEIGEKIDVLVGPRRSIMAKAQGVQPLSAFAMDNATKLIKQNFGLEPIKSIQPKGVKTKSAHDEATVVHKYRMDIETAVTLAQTAGPSFAVEVDSHLRYGAYAPSSLMQQLINNQSFGHGGLREKTVRFRVIGEGDKPLEGVSVTMEAAGFPQEGRTNSKGELTLKLFELPGANLVKSIFVRPNKGHWNRILNAPQLSLNGLNVIRLKPISEQVPNFPKGAAYGYGQKLMGLDQLPDEFTGKGVKIAIIDSGADPKHPSLSHLKEGYDMTNGGDEASWKTDVIGHGSHCAGIITGKGPDADAIRGFAPEAEIIVLKVFPGGQFSSLLEALEKCIELEVDVVNMSLGGGDKSEVVQQQIEECVANGISCIVAAGNSGGPVQFPASSPSVLAVAALGQLGQFPEDTWEATNVQPAMVAENGVFSPAFTCHGPEIAVAGPGVGIVSTVPEGAFDPQSGTSMAAPHICGMAALVLAHHPLFKTLKRDATRVSHLFRLMRESAQSVSLGAERVGSGMPSLHAIMHQFERPVATQAGGDVNMAAAGPQTNGMHYPVGMTSGGIYVPAAAHYAARPQTIYWA